MANQPTKYRKFVVGAASAALVASAVAPVASAATFSDTKGNTHEAAINALVEAGIIKGYEDGTFQPNKTLTRSDVVKMMGKWLVSLGYEVPEDYKTVQRFDDLPLTANDELLQYAALTYDAGVFKGNNGNLEAAGNITRENMAIVLVRAFDAINETDLVAFVKEQDFTGKVTDKAAAKAEARDYIDVLDYFGLTSVAKFDPKATTTRGQFATFLYRTSETEAPAEVVTTATEVKSVSATNLKEVVVEFDGTVDEDTATDKANYTLKSGKAIKFVTLSEDEKTVVLTLEDGVTLNNNRTEALSVSNVKAGESTVSGTNIEFRVFDNAIPEVTGVKSLGTKAVKVTFSEPVTNVKQSNFTLDGKSFYGKVNVVGNEVILTPYSTTALAVGDHSLQVSKVEDFANFTSLTSTHDFTVAEDNDAPTIAEASATLETLTLTFSEDVDTDTISASKVYWKSGDAKKAAYDYDVLAGNKVRYYFKEDNTLPTGSVAVYVEGVKDYSGNEIAKDTKVVVTPEIDQTRPEVKKVEVANSKTVEVTFSKALESDSAQNKNNYTVLNKDGKVISVQDAVLSADKKTVTVTLYTALSTGKNTLTVKNVKDNTKLQNTMLDYSADLTVADTTAPKIDSAVWNNDDRRVVVKFNEKMDVESLTNYSNYHVKVNGSYRALTSSIADIEVIQDGTAVAITFVEKIGNTTVEFKAGSVEELQLLAVKDVTGNLLSEFTANSGNKIDLTSSVSFGLGQYDKFGTTVYNAALVDRKTVEIKFNFPVNAVETNAITVASGSNVIDAIEVNGTSTVKVKFKNNFATDASDVNLSVDFTKLVTLAGAKATGSATIAKGQGSNAGKLLDEVAPTVNTTEKYAVDSATKKITVPFTEALSLNGASDVLAAQDFKVTRVTDNKVLKPGIDYKVGLANSDKDVEITLTDSDTTITGSLYLVEVVSGAKYISDTSDAKNFISSTSARETAAKIDQAAPVILSARYIDVDNDDTVNTGDKVEITFSENLKFATGKDEDDIIADLVLSAGTSFGTTATAVLSGNKVTITLDGTGVAIGSSPTVDVAGSPAALTDIIGNLIESTGTPVEIE
ncbi:S-layer homology domain-containing protein [Sporosarcina sp. UB5]|uniref:S-layer homology domain-containing protein n=1 Tax=Sporosarcina sp. UB5 TaxID=3047463 RepID=UPI003D7B6221